MSADLTWLVGQEISEVKKLDHSWFFTLENGGSIATESFWRLLAEDIIFVTSDDDGHIFGLPKPVDATERLIKTIQGQKISRFLVVEFTCDLLLYFSNGAQIHFLNTSCGYESWRICFKTQQVICMGGSPAKFQRLRRPTRDPRKNRHRLNWSWLGWKPSSEIRR